MDTKSTNSERTLFEQQYTCGCNFDATKRFIKTATINRINFKTATTIPILNNTTIKIIRLWSLFFILLTIMQTLPINTNAMIVRHRKRSNHNHNLLEWENPCGGKYFVHNSADISTSSRKIAFRNLRRSIRANNQRLQDERLSAIDISDISTWVKLNQTYKFLTQVKPNSNINLTRWHKSVQVYVASFSYLRKKQEKVDSKYKYENRPVSMELRKLLNNAINVLCEIETAINATTNRTLQTISREEMENRLTFRTKMNLKNESDNNVSDLIEVDQIDLKFVKARYYELLNGFGKTLRKWLKQQRRRKLCKNQHSNSNNSSYNSNSSSSSSSSSSSNNLSNISSSSSSIESSTNKNERNLCRNFHHKKRNRNSIRRLLVLN